MALCGCSLRVGGMLAPQIIFLVSSEMLTTASFHIHSSPCSDHENTYKMTSHDMNFT